MNSTKGRRALRQYCILSGFVLLALVSACNSPTEDRPPVDLPDAVGPAISPLLVGNNVWLNPSSQVWEVTSQAGLGLVRVGGIRYDNDMPALGVLGDWVNRIKAMGAEPMIQVSRFDGPAAAAAVVKHFNVDSNNRVTYWNIGNEPHCGENNLASAQNVARFVKEIAPAMKAVDPTIKIFAPDECDLLTTYYSALFRGDGSENDITGKVPDQDYYYVDGISWHRYVGYPPASLQIPQLTTAGVEDFVTRIERTREMVDDANAARGRTGADALEWGIGEFNSSEGNRVCSFENGQMFGQIYGAVMKYGGKYAATWSIYEHGGSCEGSDYSFINNDMTPRATYYHMQLISRYFSGYYLDGNSNTNEIRGFGAIDPDERRIAVMLQNIDTADDVTCTVRLNAAPAATDDCRVNVPAELGVDHEETIGRQTTVVLLFDLEGELFSRITYSRDAQWQNKQAPFVDNQP